MIDTHVITREEEKDDDDNGYNDFDANSHMTGWM